MDSRWCKIKRNIYKKRYSLYSICIGFVFFILLWILTAVFKQSLCLVKNLFGIQCFGCGMTRGFIAILNLDFYSAVCFNVLSIPLFLGILSYLTLMIIDILFSKHLVDKFEKFLSKKFMLFVYVIILVVSVVLNNLCTPIK